jgi:2-keto-3-deoxy-L-rhamnonate aldolase RhmA
VRIEGYNDVVKILLNCGIFCIFTLQADIMTTLTVNIEDKKTEKAIKAVLDAFGLDYNVAKDADVAKRPLSKQEQKMYDRLERSAKQINLYKEGKVEMKTIEEVLAELS